MAKLSYSIPTFTPVAVADATNFTDSGYIALQGGSTTQINTVYEFLLGGQAGASSPSIMVVARDSTIGATLSGGRQAAFDPATAALAAPPVGFSIATTKPQRSATLHLLNLSFNAFGGVVRWVAAPGEEIKTLGSTASLGELSLSAFTGGTPGLTGAHVVFEPS